MVLHLEGGQDVRLSQMGPEFIILREALAVNSVPQDASITLKVDDHSEEIPVTFPSGIPAGAHRVPIAEEIPAAMAAV